MRELTEYRTAHVPRFNAWRYVAMVTAFILILLIPFVGYFFYQLTKSEVNIAEYYFMSGTDKGEELSNLKAQVAKLTADTTRMGKKIRILELNAPSEISISNSSHSTAKLPAIKPYSRTQSEFPNYGAWATEGMRYYRNSVNQLYKSCGATYQVK